MIFAQNQQSIDLQVAVAQTQSDQSRKVTKIAKGLIKAQKADKENYMPIDAENVHKKQLKKRKSKKVVQQSFNLGIGLDD